MSFYRPPESSSLTVWAGRAAAVGGMLIGATSFLSGLPMGGISAALGGSLFTVVETFWPLLVGVGSSLAILRSSEKAAEVNRDSHDYHQALEHAMNRGSTDMHLPPRMLNKAAQVSPLVTGLGSFASVIGIAAGGFMLASVASAMILGGAAGAPLISKALIAGATFAAGVAGWKVSSVAAEARDFANSREAEAERGRLARERATGRSVGAAPPIPAVAPTPLSNLIDQNQRNEMLGADLAAAKGSHVERLLAERGQQQGHGIA